MEAFESLFTVIVRFNLIAFFLLGACLWGIQLLKQPLERIRLVEVSLLALFSTLALGAVGIVPKVNLAILPAVESADGNAASIESIRHASESQPNAQVPTDVPVSKGAFAASALGDGDLKSTDREGVLREHRPESVPLAHAVSGFGPLSWLKQSLTVILLAVSFLNLVYLAVGYAITRQLVNRAKPLTDATLARVERIVTNFPGQHKVKYASSSSIDVPMVIGFCRPTVLLPERLSQSDADQLELKHSLAHEWSHIQLHDLLTWQLASFCQVFLWMQPCYWVLRRELRVAQDQLADQFAIEQTQEHITYAKTLLDLSKARQRLLPGALTMAGNKSNLYRRIEMMMNENFRIVRATRKSTLLLLAVLFVAAGGLMTSLELTRAETPAVTETTNHLVDGGNKDTVAKNDNNEKSAEHTGVLIDADTGKPIAGVTVTVTRMESDNWQELGVTKSLTDENGKYSFTIPPEQLKLPLLYILFDIDHPTYAQRHCGSYGYGMVVDNLKNGEQPWFSEFKMVRGEKITGRLVDDEKRPIADAQIRSDCRPKSGNDRDRTSAVDAVSDKNGRFEIVVPYDGIAKLSFIPLDHCMKYIDVGEKRGELGDITLDTGVSIQGVVKDAAGNPMSGLWVNLTPEKDRNDAHYEMKRSAKTDKDGKFVTRPLKAEKCEVEVDTKATGALEKEKYANFHDTPPSAMFVNRSINVTKDTASKPFVIQAVPHVLITVQTFRPNGEVSGGHSPSMTGKVDGKFLWIPEGRKTGKGAFELMVPHGIEDAQLRFTTNEHSALMVQFVGGELSPQTSFKFKKLEENLDNIRVIRHEAGILKLDIVDEAGKRLDEARIFAHYDIAEKHSEEMMMDTQIGWNKEDGLFRLSSIVPSAPVSIRFNAAGCLTQTQKFTLSDDERRTVTITLKKGEDEKPAVDK